MQGAPHLSALALQIEAVALTSGATDDERFRRALALIEARLKAGDVGECELLGMLRSRSQDSDGAPERLFRRLADNIGGHA